MQAPLLRAEGGRHGVLVREGLLLERGIEGIVEVVPAVLFLLFGEGDDFLATTTLLTRHANEGETIAAAIKDCLDYGKNPQKTEGKYISAYECDPATVADEFLLAKAS